jgi:hypothetical protein
MNPQKAAEMKRQLIAFAAKKQEFAVEAERQGISRTGDAVLQAPAVVLPYKKVLAVPAKKVQAKASLKTSVRPMRARQAVAAAR